MGSTWQPPAGYRNRPVAVLGGGVLGRRIGTIWASAGYDVHIRDPSAEQRAAALEYINENVNAYAQKTKKTPGAAHAFENVRDAVEKAWLVIEAIPERINLKIDTFAELATVAPADSILASNSSSYKSSEMLEKVPAEAKARILNMHYYMPPQCMIVELMTDGHTTQDIFPFMVERSKEAATLPYVARKESTGFIFNRLWAAVKRETLTILAEGVSVPEEIDSMWTEMFIKGKSVPCRMMDNVGLDTVAFIEQHYIHERGLSSEKTVDFLQKNYLADGKLGNKSSKGGLYPPKENDASANRKIIALDIGLSAAPPTTTSGEIVELSLDGKVQRILAKNQSLPDGIDIDRENDRIIWTCMGSPAKNDGAVYSARLDGTDVKTIVPHGAVNTPKQLTLDTTAKKVYFCDREGFRVFRCNYDGSELENLIKNGDFNSQEDVNNGGDKWCVGITVSPKLGKFYWTQKGYSKSGKGRIFRANIKTPAGESPSSRSDVELVLGNLPEPIDLELDETSHTLYWTDRGEIPNGNALYRAKLDDAGLPIPISASSSQKYEILARNFHETIGLKLDLEHRAIYLTDLGGSIYKYDVDTQTKERIFYEENRAFTGIAIL